MGHLGFRGKSPEKGSLSSLCTPENTFPRAHDVWVTGTAPPSLLPRCVQPLSAPLSQAASRGPIAFGWVDRQGMPALARPVHSRAPALCTRIHHELVPAHREVGYKVSRAAFPRGTVGEGWEPRVHSKEPRVLGSWQPLGSSNSLSPTGRGALGITPASGSQKRIIPCSEWSLLGCDDLMPVEAMTGQQVQGLCPAHPHPPALWSPLPSSTHSAPPPPPPPRGLLWGSSQLRLWRNKKPLPWSRVRQACPLGLVGWEGPQAEFPYPLPLVALSYIPLFSLTSAFNFKRTFLLDLSTQALQGEA